MKDFTRLERTKELSLKSSFVTKAGRGRRMAASIYYRNRYLCSAVNVSKTHPLQIKYNEDTLDFVRTNFLHAEMAAMIKAFRILGEEDLSNCTLYVARKLNCDGYGLARPCPACREAMNQYGIQKVVYTTDEGYATEYLLEERK